MSQSLIKATVLAKNLGISRYTVKTWCQQQSGLAYKRGRDWYIRIDELAKRDGLDPVKVLTLTKEPWLKAVDLAARSNIPRRTIAHWCRNRPHFGLRLGRIWYVNPSQLGATAEQIDIMRRWAPKHTSVIKFLETTGEPSNGGWEKEEA